MTNLLQTIGGLGIFLLGMIILTDGLRSLAGQSIRAALMRFTRTPLSGVITGAISTALLQSSSATTVAAVGFVSVGLLGFSEALGIIFGANIGTTITGWLVALVGFKLQLGLLALPLIFIGAVLRLFSSGKLAYTGHAIAGFGLIFVGISFLQQGMSGMQNYISFEQFPADDLLGRLQLVLMGIMFTLITQSSSAGVAASLSALFAHLINFEQAATLIIGMDIGTTVTAAFATIGGSIETRRTGYSHVIYNLFTGIGALVLISPFVWIWQNLSQQPIGNNAEIALVAFHTTFNFIGVLVVLPVTKQFARLMHKLVPDVETSGAHPLDAALLNKPAQALNQLQIVIQEQFSSLLQHILFLLDSQHPGQHIDLTR
ncbi:MAG: Na/Pi symporter, partial [Gammaproteobacteria bacterium]|nr:Na/Pi symporter [Gammaproteobacteria bacterium]